jgi:hypothetical protein
MDALDRLIESGLARDEAKLEPRALHELAYGQRSSFVHVLPFSQSRHV